MNMRSESDGALPYIHGMKPLDFECRTVGRVFLGAQPVDEINAMICCSGGAL